MDCPKCIGKLQEKAITIRRASSLETLKGATTSWELKIDQCFVCEGLWFDRGELNKYVHDDVEVLDSPSRCKKTDAEYNKKDGLCPKCNKLMRKEHYPGSSVTIDLCTVCCGVWLDPFEIDKVERSQKKSATFFQSLLKFISEGKGGMHA